MPRNNSEFDSQQQIDIQTDRLDQHARHTVIQDVPSKHLKRKARTDWAMDC